MSPSVELSSSTFGRLQKHAIPLVDTIDSVISRMIDAYEQEEDASNGPLQGENLTKARLFNPDAPPDLTHTKILAVTFCGRPLGHGQDNWNGVLNAAASEAKARATSSDELRKLIIVNYVDGSKQDEGYRFLPDAGISLQGQNANDAWRAASHIAQRLGCELSVRFVWREKEGAAFPGVTGQFSLPGKE